MMKLGTIITYLGNIQKHINHVTKPLSSADITTFLPAIRTFVISRNKDIDCILMHSFYCFELFRVFKGCFDKHGCNFDDIS